MGKADPVLVPGLGLLGPPPGHPRKESAATPIATAIDSPVAVAHRAFSLALGMLCSRMVWAADIVVS